MGLRGVAVVGAGYWGPNLARNFESSLEWDLRWVCDLDTDRAHAILHPYSPARVTTDLNDVLDDPRVEAVAVATPAGTHAEIVVRALDAGRHVLVEKPLATTVADAEKLVSLAEERELALMCDHTYCFTPVVQKIRDLIGSGDLGDIHYVDSVRINLGLVQRDIDVLWDLAPHDLSILDFVLQPDRSPTGVAAHGADPIGAGVACVGYLTMPLNGGGIAHAHVNWLSPTKIRTMVFGGSRRTIVWDDLHPTQRLSVHDRGVDLAASDVPAHERRARMISYRIGDIVAPALGEAEALGEVVREFAAAISERRPARTDGQSGLRVVRMLEAASRSLASNGTTQPIR